MLPPAVALDVDPRGRAGAACGRLKPEGVPPAGAPGSGLPPPAEGNQTAPPAASGGACLPPAARPDRAEPARREASWPPPDEDQQAPCRIHAELAPQWSRVRAVYAGQCLKQQSTGHLPPEAKAQVRILPRHRQQGNAPW